MVKSSESCQHHLYRRHVSAGTISLSESSTERSASLRLCQPQWIILVSLSLLMIYIDSKSITSFIIINDRQISLDLPKYISSITEAMASVQNEAPALLRGSQRTQRTNSKETSNYGTERKGQVFNSLHPNYFPNSHTRYAVSEPNTRNESPIKVMADVVGIPTSVANINGIADEPNTIVSAVERSDDKESKPNSTVVWSKQSDVSNASTTRPTNKRLTEDSNNRFEASENQNVLDPVPIDSKLIAAVANFSTIITTRSKVLCLYGDAYGRTMNQYLQLATILHLVGINGTTVVAFKNPLFTTFYTTWFEQRDDIIVSYDYDAPCDAEYDAATLHYLFFEDKWKQVAYQFKTLQPKASIKEEAGRAMKEYSGSNNLPITTIHRRDLEGACVLFAEKKNLITCPNIKSSLEMSISEYKNACLIDYSMISNATQETNVVLFTDGQVPELDETFPIISNHTFAVQSWMMAISDVHYGNPFSTVDIVVYFWRLALSESNGGNNDNNKMQPSACYKPTPMV